MWRERIQAARERGYFTSKDKRDAGGIGRETGYGLCAVGEQADCVGAPLIFHYPEDRIGVLDEFLKAWGGAFAGAVSVDDYDEAERLLDLIEDRALAIKRELST